MFFRKWQQLLSPAGIAGLTALFYGTTIEPYRPTLTRIEIPLANLPPAFDGFTIAHISDIHVGSWTSSRHLNNVMRQINALNTDMIVLTGDYVIRVLRPSFMQMLLESLRILRAKEGVYGVLGNHDYKVDAYAVREQVKMGGVHLLANDHIAIQRGDQTLYLAGIEDVLRGNEDLDAALEGIPPGACIILLAHEPDYADEVARDGRVRLQLSGHTHGGQVRIPILGPVYSQLPKMACIYIMGLYHVEQLTLYVTRGIGMVRPFVRFNCPPEIVHITLRKMA